MTNKNTDIDVVYEPEHETAQGKKGTKIQLINREIVQELADEGTKRALLATTFKGLNEQSMKQALLEGMIRGFKFEDFFKKLVYALPFKDNRTGTVGYSLIVSIDYLRKMGASSGVVGKTRPEFIFEEVNGKRVLESCEITVKKLIQGHVGEFTAVVYFDEYTTNKNLWVSKPKTMLAKVAEAHAYRMACPEVFSNLYLEEEMEKEQANATKFQDVDTKGLAIGNYTKDEEDTKDEEEAENTTTKGSEAKED